ncbi:MAG: FG-GAP-like repeat-containing protein, partial [Candidatus Omnitrophota bacterium]
MFKRALSLLLVILHMATFGPMREAFAYSASSANYKLTTGSPTQGGANRGLGGDQILKDAIGEPCAQKSTSSNYALSSGFIPTLQSNPPQAKHIPAQFWQKNTAKTDAFDLDDYFSSPDGLELTYTFEKLNTDAKINIAIDPLTHLASFSQPQDYSGTEKVRFKAADSEGEFVLSNKVALQVLGDKNQPVIDEITIEPANFKQGDLITITVKAIDMDGDALSFSYTPEGFFQEVKKEQDPQDPHIWYSAATWQTTPQHQGYYSIGIKVTDSTGLFDTDSVDLRLGVDNHPPVIKKINGQDVTPGQPVALTAKEGELFVFNIEVEDPDKNTITLSYFWPQGFDNPQGNEGKWDIPYTIANSANPSVSKTIAVTASDRIDTATAEVALTVANTNRAPQASLFLSKYTLLKNEEFTIKLEAFDRDGDALNFDLYKDGIKLASGRINYAEPYTTTASFADNGKHTISAVLTDPAGLSSPSSNKEVDVADVDIHVNPLLGDYNGDALTDLGIFNYKTGEWKIALSKKGAFESAGGWLSNFGASDSGEWIPVGGDFNGDGLMDVGSYNSISGELKIALSTSSSFAKQDQPWLKFPEASYKKRYCETHEVCSGFWIFESCEDVEVCSEYPYSPWQPFTGNFNADKYTDFALYNKDSGEVKIAIGTGSGFKPFTAWLTASDSHKDSTALAGDFNGDSLADLLLFKKSTGETRLLFSNTKEFVDEADWTPPAGFSAKDKDLILSDFNNDGLTDIGYWDKDSSKWYYVVSKGDKFTVINNGVWLEGFGSKDAESASTGDFNGDGLTDAAVFDKEELGIDCWDTKLSSNKPADLLTVINNGIGGQTKVVYSYASLENQDY